MRITTLGIAYEWVAETRREKLQLLVLLNSRVGSCATGRSGRRGCSARQICITF